jgi:uncharacterized protein YecT (DUF1311 family)
MRLSAENGGFRTEAWTKRKLFAKSTQIQALNLLSGSLMYFHRWLRARSLLVCAAFLLPPIAGVCAEESSQSADLAVKACLELVQKNVDARPPHEEDELTEKTGPRGRLDAARAAAAFQSEGCIGVAATACIQAEGNTSTAVMSACYESEAGAWDKRLNAAYKTLLANGDGDDVAEGYRKTQRAWMAFRDASCAQPSIVFKGTMAIPMSAYCRLSMTARQAIWLEGWLK